MAGSSVLDKLGMRKLVERMTFRMVKAGFQVGTKTARAFKGSAGGRAERLKAPGLSWRASRQRNATCWICCQRVLRNLVLIAHSFFPTNPSSASSK